jgi:Leucine-rich repeat (LRR) protein
MTNLETLDVSRNHLIGSLPERFGDNVNQLSLGTLRASSNELTGGLPSEISNFEKLVVLELGMWLVRTLPRG